MGPRLRLERLGKKRPQGACSLGFLARIDGHDVPVDHGHGASGGGRHEVTVHFEDGPLPKQSLRQRLARQLPRCLQFLVPVPRLPRDVLLVAQLEREGCGRERQVSEMLSKLNFISYSDRIYFVSF